MGGAPPFELVGVVHLVRPVGIEVHDLEELRQALQRVPERSLFHHTAGRLLRHPGAEELPPDDVSGWVAGVVQDRHTAERISFAVGSTRTAEPLRAALIEVLDSVSEKDRVAHDAPPGGDLVFLTAESVPIPTGESFHNARELIEQLAEADASVWFYHLIEQGWTTPESVPLVEWLRAQGAGRLADTLFETAHSGRPLEDIRSRVLRRWRFNRLGQRVAAAAGSTEQERVEAGREAMGRLVRRMSQSGDET